MPKQQTTESSSSEPWKPAQPALETGLKDAQTLDAGGVGSRVNTSSNVVPLARQSTQAFGNMQTNASANMGGQGLSGQMQGVIDRGGFTGDQKNSMSYLNKVADANPYDLSANPAYGKYRSDTLGDVANQTNGSFSAAGRYGSGAHSGALATGLGRVGTEMDMGQIQSNIGRADNANQQRFSMGQQGFGNVGSAYQGLNMPNQDLLKVGSAYEDLAGRQIDDRNRIFDETQNRPWENLARMNAIASGSGSLGETSSGTSRQPSNLFGQIGGGLLGLTGMLGR
jgi:hypothetical protein